LSNLLNLNGWSTSATVESEHDLLIPAEYRVEPPCCIRCGNAEPRLKKHGVQEQLFMDTPLHGKRVGIRVKRQRFKCFDCGGTFQQQLPDMDEKRTMTGRLVKHVEKLSLERTFSQIANDVGVHEKTVRNIFNDHIGELNASYWPLTPNYIGIDELFLVGKPRCIFTNCMENTIMDLLPNRDKATVTAWLMQRQLRELVEVVTIDMWKPYRDAALTAMPDATVVVDKFHVVKLANHALDTVRRSLREGKTAKERRVLLRSRHLILKRRKDLTPEEFTAMQEWTDAVPVLFHAYQAKEDFFDIYQCRDRLEAMELYDVWKACLDPATKSTFYEVIRAVDNWRPEIFNYFVYPVTNAYTESANGVAKVLARMGRGYSFDAIRAKVLFGQAKHKRPKFGETFGVSVPHLVRLDRGHASDTLNSE